MKIKSAISTIMFYVSVSVTIFLFLMVVSINDLARGEFLPYLKLFSCLVVALIVSSALYDYRFYSRHFFAIRQLLKLLYGVVTGKKSRSYRKLYRLLIGNGSVSGFYSSMLKVYDRYAEDVVTLRTRLARR